MSSLGKLNEVRGRDAMADPSAAVPSFLFITCERLESHCRGTA